MAELGSRSARFKAPRLTIYNHKGGVGKTTLTVNLAVAMAERGHRVLLVDSDPQCNLTSYLVSEDVVNALLDGSDAPTGQTLWSALKPIAEAEGDINIVPTIETPFGPYLLPGDVRVAEFETQLEDLWGEAFKRRLKGFRGITALSALVNEVAREVDAGVVLYDTGPNIGPLNRVISLDCDFFVVPVACDVFSLRAIKTLGHTLSGWMMLWKQLESIVPENFNLLPGKPKPLGYVAQRFRVYRSTPASTFNEFLPRIEKGFSEDLLTVLERQDRSLVAYAKAPLRLANIQDYGSIANAAQRDGVPLWKADQGTPQAREVPRADFHDFAKNVLERVGLE